MVDSCTFRLQHPVCLYTTPSLSDDDYFQWNDSSLRCVHTPLHIRGRKGTRSMQSQRPHARRAYRVCVPLKDDLTARKETRLRSAPRWNPGSFGAASNVLLPRRFPLAATRQSSPSGFAQSALAGPRLRTTWSCPRSSLATGRTRSANRLGCSSNPARCAPPPTDRTRSRGHSRNLSRCAPPSRCCSPPRSRGHSRYGSCCGLGDGVRVRIRYWRATGVQLHESYSTAGACGPAKMQHPVVDLKTRSPTLRPCRFKLERNHNIEQESRTARFQYVGRYGAFFADPLSHDAASG